MRRWRITLLDLFVIITLVSASIYFGTLGGKAIVMGFLPGSYVAGTALRRDFRRTTGDLLLRVAMCGVGGSISLFTLVATILIAQWSSSPLWLVLLLLTGFSLIGFVLGAVYGAAETGVLWLHRPAS